MRDLTVSLNALAIGRGRRCVLNETFAERRDSRRNTIPAMKDQSNQLPLMRDEIADFLSLALETIWPIVCIGGYA